MTNLKASKPLTQSKVGTLLQVDVQQVLDDQDYADAEEPPSHAQLTQWANAAYSMLDGELGKQDSEVTIRLVETVEMTGLNRDYRHQDKPTNVLSFPCEPFPFDSMGADSISFELISPGNGPDVTLLGDIVICHPVIVSEAREQQKTVSDHYAHMVAHGLLHLCGYDHQDEQTAEQMEALEIEILAYAKIANPYNES